MKVMKLLLNNYPRKHSKEELKFIQQEEEAELISATFIAMFDDIKKDE